MYKMCVHIYTYVCVYKIYNLNKCSGIKCLHLASLLMHLYHKYLPMCNVWSLARKKQSDWLSKSLNSFHTVNMISRIRYFNDFLFHNFLALALSPNKEGSFMVTEDCAIQQKRVNSLSALHPLNANAPSHLHQCKMLFISSCLYPNILSDAPRVFFWKFQSSEF